MRVQVTQQVDHALVSPSGELDTASAQELGEAIRVGFEAGLPLVVLDLADVTFMDSTATTALVHEHDAARQRGLGLRLAAAPAPVVRVLAMLGVDAVLEVYPTVAEAVVG